MQTPTIIPIRPKMRPVARLADVPPTAWRTLLECLQPERRARGAVAEVVCLARWRAERGR